MTNPYTVARNHVETLEKRVEDTYGKEYKWAAMVGSLEATLSSILFRVYYSNPDAYKDILEQLESHSK